MDIHEDLTVKMPYWQWMWLLGWLTGGIERSGLPETKVIGGQVATTIAQSVQP